MSHKSTIERLREILTEMFGEERTAAITDDTNPWHEIIGAKAIDIIDFKCFVQEQMHVWLISVHDVSLADLARYIDATTPSTKPY